MEKVERLQDSLPELSKISFNPLDAQEKHAAFLLPEVRDIFGIDTENTYSADTYEYDGKKIGYVIYSPVRIPQEEKQMSPIARGAIIDIDKNGQVIGYTSFSGVIDSNFRLNSPQLYHYDHPSVNYTFTKKEATEKGLATKRLIALNKLMQEKYNETLRSSTVLLADVNGQKVSEHIWQNLKRAGLAEDDQSHQNEKRYKFK